MKKADDIHCALCRVENQACSQPGGKSPTFCPTMKKQDVVEESLKEYEKSSVGEFARNAAIQEGECYVAHPDNPDIKITVKPRIQETIEFCHKMGYKKIGMAFCAGLKKEAAAVEGIFRAQGLEVCSVVCKVGAIPKERLGLVDSQKIHPGEYESMCNPVAQAMIMNTEKTDFNIIVGLCVGHDSLVMKYSDAMCTVLVVKDRVTGHNPLAAINCAESYYARLKKVPMEKGGNLCLSKED